MAKKNSVFHLHLENRISTFSIESIKKSGHLAITKVCDQKNRVKSRVFFENSWPFPFSKLAILPTYLAISTIWSQTLAAFSKLIWPFGHFLATKWPLIFRFWPRYLEDFSTTFVTTFTHTNKKNSPKNPNEHPQKDKKRSPRISPEASFLSQLGRLLSQISQYS